MKPQDKQVPRRMQKGPGHPAFCWNCSRQLQRAVGKGLGLFYFNIVRGADGVDHRVHGYPCTQECIDDGMSVIHPEPRP